MGKIIGFIMYGGAGLIMFVFWFMAMAKWLGLLGMVLALVLSPGLVIFPIIFWIVEKTFPVFYFVVWGIGLVGLMIAGLSAKD